MKSKLVIGFTIGSAVGLVAFISFVWLRNYREMRESKEYISVNLPMQDEDTST